MNAALFTVALPFEAGHPTFAGHFPGRPIVPGVQLIDRAKRLIEARQGFVLGGLQMAKFVSPAGPGEPLELDYRLDGGGVTFEIRSGSRRVVTGRFTGAGPAAP